MTREELLKLMADAIQDGDLAKSGPLQQAYARSAAKRTLTAIESAGIPVSGILSGEWVVTQAEPEDIEQNERQRLAIAMLADARAARKRNGRRGR